jgi:uncharacterized protein YbjT (DUF2867 family)
MHLVTGATGNIGRPLVDQLHVAGRDVRALVRDASRATDLPEGVDIATGNLDDVDSLATAMDGVDSVFLLHVGAGTTQTANVITAARAAGVRRIVLLSSVGVRILPIAGLIPATLSAREDLLRASGLDVTYLRPQSLMSNAFAWIDSIRSSNQVVDSTDPGRVVPVDPEDIARVATTVLTEAGHTGHGYILGGPEAMTVREQVETLSDVLGRKIEFVAITPEQAAQRAIENGVPARMAEATQALNEMFRGRLVGQTSDDIENVTGVAPARFRDWCERNVARFR